MAWFVEKFNGRRFPLGRMQPSKSSVNLTFGRASASSAQADHRADDDDPRIATYSQAGAQFGNSMLWTVVFTLPLMVAIQIVSARIGYVTRHGLAANVKASFPRWVLLCVVGMLLAANTLNVAADIAAMAEALRCWLGARPVILYFGLWPGVAGLPPLQDLLRW